MIKLSITLVVETTAEKAAKVLALERKKYKRNPNISVPDGESGERVATVEEAIESELDAYMDAVERAIPVRYGTVVSMSAHWVDKESSAI